MSACPPSFSNNIWGFFWFLFIVDISSVLPLSCKGRMCLKNILRKVFWKLDPCAGLSVFFSSNICYYSTFLELLSRGNVVNSFFSIILQRQNLPTSNLCHLRTSLLWVSLMLEAIIHISLLSVTCMLISSLAHMLTSEVLWVNVLYRDFFFWQPRILLCPVVAAETFSFHCWWESVCVHRRIICAAVSKAFFSPHKIYIIQTI